MKFCKGGVRNELEHQPDYFDLRGKSKFSRVARMAEKHGELYIFKNNKPKYKLVNIEQDATIEMTDDEKIDFVAARILKLYRPAFEELAK